MDLFEIFPYFMVAIAGGVAAFFIFWYWRIHRYPPSDEPEVGEYRIELDVGSHIVSLTGTLFYFTKFLNPMNFQTLYEALKKAKKETGLKPLQTFLKKKAHFYAMRQGTRKVVIVSVYHPIEISPFFKSEQGSLKKVVHASGWMGKQTGGFQHVVMEPLDLSKNTLNPTVMRDFDKCGALLTAIHEQTPLLEEIQVAKESNNILQKKVDGMADDMGKLKDDLEYWKHQARKRGAVEEPERGLIVPPFIRMLIPYVIAFAVGYLLSPSIIYTAAFHPMFLGFGFAAALFVIRRWILRR